MCGAPLVNGLGQSNPVSQNKWSEGTQRINLHFFAFSLPLGGSKHCGKITYRYNFQQTNCVKFLHGVEVDETRTGVDNVDKNAINAGADAMVGQVT